MLFHPEHSHFKATHFYHIKTNNYRIVQVGRDLMRFPVHTPAQSRVSITELRTWPRWLRKPLSWVAPQPLQAPLSLPESPHGIRPHQIMSEPAPGSLVTQTSLSEGSCTLRAASSTKEYFEAYSQGCLGAI